MTVTSLASFTEAKKKKEEKLLKEQKKWRLRYLGGRVHIAHNDYSCSHCVFPIVPGEQYQRDVYARYKWIHIEKHHWPQCYGPSEDEDREMQEQMEREREAEKEAERKAA